MSVGETEAAHIDDRPLDPFGFFPNFISRIEGLGGTEPTFDPFFAFHTPYIQAPSGRWRFTLRFKNLRVETGTLVVRIHVLPDAPGAVARLINSERRLLAKLTGDEASLTIDFVGMKNATFALMGQVPDRTDAKADALFVTLSSMQQLPHDDQDEANVENTPFRTDAVVANSLVVSASEPSLADPVSQTCTARQLAEPTFVSWSNRLGNTAASNIDGWCEVFPLQTLDRYGSLRAGARGLLTAVSEAQTSLLLDIGIDLEHIAALEYHAPRTAPRADFLVNIDKNGETGRERMGSMILSSLLLVRPGGIVIHIFPYTHDAPDNRTDATSALDRWNIERIAFAVIGAGHDLAQLKPSVADGMKRKPNTIFGLIARRAVIPD